MCHQTFKNGGAYLSPYAVFKEISKSERKRITSSIIINRHTFVWDVAFEPIIGGIEQD